MTCEILVSRGGPRGSYRTSAAAAALLAAGWLGLQPAAPAQAAAPGAIDRACTADLQLAPGTADYLICAATLRRVAAGIDQRDAIDHERLACAQQGLQPGTPGFATCVVGSTDRVSTETAP